MEVSQSETGNNRNSDKMPQSSTIKTLAHLSKRGTAAFYRCLSACTTSSTFGGLSSHWLYPLSSSCHSSVSSVACLRWRISLLSRSGMPHVSEWVAATVHPSRNPNLVCSLVILLQRSRGERVFSCASVVLRLRSAVLWLAFFTSAQTAS